ncbi:MAG: DsbC family protein [Thermodesulfobacteriota bacterium]
MALPVNQAVSEILPMPFTTLLVALLAVFGPVTHAIAFQESGCGVGQCRDCHELSKPDAEKLLKDMVSEVLTVQDSEVPGLWMVEVRQNDRKFPVYIDYSKRFVVSGNVIRIATQENLTREKVIEMNRVDVSQIPLEDALVLGSRQAANRIIVFDDPECSYCQKLQPEMQAVVAQRPDIAFYIKMFPLQSHPTAYDKAKAIVCAASLGLLEDSLAGKPIPAATCAGEAVDQNIALGARLRINSTPTLILGDGRVIPGFKPADRMIELVGEPPKE